jgi:hypothetical protein
LNIPGRRPRPTAAMTRRMDGRVDRPCYKLIKVLQGEYKRAIFADAMVQIKA